MKRGLSQFAKCLWEELSGQLCKVACLFWDEEEKGLGDFLGSSVASLLFMYL